jgi:hypothetical protein
LMTSAGVPMVAATNPAVILKKIKQHAFIINSNMCVTIRK